MSGDGGIPKIKMRTYFSSHHLWAAKHFAKLAGCIEDSADGKSYFNFEHRAYVTAAILCAVAFLEAAINEVFQDAFDEHPSYVGSLNSETRALMKDFWEGTEETKKSATRILDKYQRALCFAGVAKFNKGRSPYQDVSSLVDLRNELVHYKPESLGGDSIHKLGKSLGGKFPENRLMVRSGNPFFPDKCLGKGCANWAVSSSRKFADEFFERVGIEPNYQRLKI